MKYCGLIVDENCHEQDGFVSIFAMTVEAEMKMHEPRWRKHIEDLNLYGVAIEDDKGNRIDPLSFTYDKPNAEGCLFYEALMKFKKKFCEER